LSESAGNSAARMGRLHNIVFHRFPGNETRCREKWGFGITGRGVISSRRYHPGRYDPEGEGNQSRHRVPSILDHAQVKQPDRKIQFLWLIGITFPRRWKKRQNSLSRTALLLWKS